MFVYTIVYPNGKIKKVKPEDVLYELYYELARVPTPKELGKGYGKTYIQQLKKRISQRDEYVPMFDIFSKNIYLIKKSKVFSRITENSFRLPDETTPKILLREIKRIQVIIDRYNREGKQIPEYYNKLMRKRKSQVTFLESFDFAELRDTFYKIFFNNNPFTENITSCRRPSFFPFLRNKPYYTKEELVNLGKNMGLDIDDDDINKTCDIVAANDIDASVLNGHNIYIRDNSYFKNFIHMYTFVGSFYFNTYLRNPSYTDPFLEKHIEYMWHIIRKAPAFNKSYYVYRFVDKDYLKSLSVGDIYEEKAFISTTRNPFYDPKNNVFGLVLMKINIPAGIEGIGLCLETFSFFPKEEEILLAPGRLKLKSIDSKYTYYHTNPIASEKIKKKYEFDYIEPFKESPIEFVIDYKENIRTIVEIDFKKFVVEGETIESKMDTFIDNIATHINNRAYFYSQIGNKRYLFQVYRRDDFRIYDKYFFLQNFSHIYFVLQDEETAEILMFVEIRERISVNYIFKFISGSNPFDEPDLLTFVSYVAKAFDVKTVIIHDDWESYQKIAEENVEDDKLSIMSYDTPEANLQIMMYSSSAIFYPKDLISYISSVSNYKYKHGSSKYRQKFTSNSVFPFLKKDDISDLRNLSFEKITDITLNTPINKIFKFFKTSYGLHSVLDFYIYLHYHFFYIINELNTLLMQHFDYYLQDINPWDTNFYILKPYYYLYERGLEPDLSEDDTDIIFDIPDQLKSSIAKKLKYGKSL